MSKLRSYQDLHVWQTGMDLLAECYGICRMLPRSEGAGFASQIQRSCVSVPANIAEGYGRTHRGDYLRHLSIANGSLKELETLLLGIVRVGLLDGARVTAALRHCEKEGRMLAALIRRVRSMPKRVVSTPDTLHPTPAASDVRS